MKFKLGKALLGLSLFATVAAFVTPAQAVPAFARQTGKACQTCHFQHYPALNDYGRDFKANGYVALGKQGTLKGTKDSELSLPEMLNASLFLKVRHQKSNGSDVDGSPTQASGEWQAPDEFAMLLGGRISSNIGFLLEGQLADPDAPFVAGFKMPMMYELAGKKVGIVPFTTDGLGAAYGFELLNTGSVRNVRVMEHRSESSAQQYIGTATPAFGAAFVAYDSSWFVNLTKWSPNHVVGNPAAELSSTYFRAAYTPTVGDWDIGVGTQIWGGSSWNADANLGAGGQVQTKAWAIDAQAQGAIANHPIGIYLAHANAEAPGAGEVGLFNTAANAKTATTVAVEYGIIPQKVTLMFAYRVADNGAAANSKDNAVTLGATYQLAQNVQLQLQHSIRDKNNGVGRYEGSDTKGDALTTFMLSAGF